MRLLIVEDDHALAAQLKISLEKAGYAVDTTDNGNDAIYMGSLFPYDTVILDLGLPGKNGLEVLREWRNRGNQVPVIILTARNAWHEKVDGFKAGTDDYVEKPFHNEELLARIQALIRRHHQQVGPRITVDELGLDEEKQQVWIGESCVPLTDVEFRLLRYLMLHANMILTKPQLEEHIYDIDSEKDSNVIEVYINRLRQKIGKERIQTRRGQGYILEKQG